MLRRSPWWCWLMGWLDFRYWRCECGYEPPYGRMISADCERHDGPWPRERPERILAAAIYVDDGKAEPRRSSYTYPATGLVFAGWRHGDCFTTMLAWAARLTPEERAAIGEQPLRGRDQGFITSRGRYVSREEAGAIAYAARQIEHPCGFLTSEDVW